MTLTAATRVEAWADGTTQVSTDLRLNLISAGLSGLGGSSSAPLAIGSGVRQGTGNPLLVAVSAGLSVTVNTGLCSVQGSAAANAGGYTVALDTVATLTCTAADPTNPRMDSVCITADAQLVQIITGTPAALPSAPALPANSLLLATVTVPAGASSLTGTNVSDQRVFLAGVGGIKPFLKSSFWPAAGNSVSSDYLHDIATGRMKRWNGSAWTAPLTAPFAAVYAGPNASATANVAAVTVESATVAVDGYTSVKVTITWAQIVTGSTVQGSGVQMQILRGATALRNYFKIASYANAVLDGGSITYTDVLPAAGTYTYSWTIINQGAGTFSVKNGDILLEPAAS